MPRPTYQLAAIVVLMHNVDTTKWVCQGLYRVVVPSVHVAHDTQGCKSTAPTRIHPAPVSSLPCPSRHRLGRRQAPLPWSSSPESVLSVSSPFSAVAAPQAAAPVSPRSPRHPPSSAPIMLSSHAVHRCCLFIFLASSHVRHPENVSTAFLVASVCPSRFG